MSRIRSDWASLPEHLLASIAKLLHTRIDILRFRSVCRSFRSVLPPLPKLLFPDSILTTTDFLKGPNPSNDKPFVLIESTVYVIEPLNKTSKAHDETSQTWLIKVEELGPGKVQIMDPLTGIRCRQLPKPLNLLDYRVAEISKSYGLQSTIHLVMCSNVILSSFPDETDDGFTVMVTHHRLRKLAMWRNVDKKWSDIDIDVKDDFFEDIIHHNNKFYALFSTGCTVTVDSKSLTVTQVATGLQLNDLGISLQYLVGSLKDLFLIIQYCDYKYNGQHFIMVFKLDEEKRMWVQVDGLELEDRVLFADDASSSYSISAKEFSGCKGSCVYFTAYNWAIRQKKRDYPGESTWICDLKDGTLGHISEFQGYSNLLWPPPVGLINSQLN